MTMIAATTFWFRSPAAPSCSRLLAACGAGGDSPLARRRQRRDRGATGVHAHHRARPRSALRFGMSNGVRLRRQRRRSWRDDDGLRLASIDFRLGHGGAAGRTADGGVAHRSRPRDHDHAASCGARFESVFAFGGNVVAMGVTASTSTATVFEGIASLQELSAGQYVEVHGYLIIRCSRVSARRASRRLATPAPGPTRRRGRPAGEVDHSSRTLRTRCSAGSTKDSAATLVVRLCPPVRAAGFLLQSMN